VEIEARDAAGSEHRLSASYVIDASGRANLTGNQQGHRILHTHLRKLAVFGHFTGVALDVGDAAVHRAFKPTVKDFKIALDVVEGVFSPIFGHMREAEKLADRVPPRAPRPAKN
jgi:hypothetical protein